MAHAQLQLITTPSDHEELWKLDPRTIQVGRQGLAQARAALARSRREAEGRGPFHEQDQATAA